MPEPTLGAEHLLPFEGGASVADVEASLFAVLDSEESEHPEEENEPAPEDAALAESGESDEAEEIEASEDESEGDDDPDESEVEEPEAPPLYKIKVDGEEVEVTLDELQKGYSRTADYTRKTQALAEKERTELAAYRAARDQLGQKLEVVEQALVGLRPEEPDWDKLRKENPAEFAALHAERELFNQKLAAVRAEKDRVRQEQEREYHEGLVARLDEERAKLHEAIPEWKDTAKASEDKGRIANYATKTYGWTEQDLGNVTDHRLMLVLRKAMLYDELQTKGAETIRDKAKPAQVLKPGGRTEAPRKGKRAEVERARQRLAQTGRADDAAALLEKYL